MIIIFGHIYFSNHALIKRSLEVNKENSAISEISEISGNAALQAVAATRAGAMASLCGTIGNDFFGKIILDTLRREGINATSVAKTDEERTGQQISISSPDNSTTTINSLGANQKTNPSQLPNNVFNERSLLLLQNDISNEINLSVCIRAQSKGGKVLLALTNKEDENKELLEKADMVIDTDNANTKGFNCFCGTLAACLQAGMSEENALHYAQTAGRLASKNGEGYSALPYLDDIEKAL